MRQALEEIVALQAEYRASNTPAIERRGHRIRNVLLAELEEHAANLRAEIGPYRADAEAVGKDNQEQMARLLDFLPLNVRLYCRLERCGD